MIAVELAVCGLQQERDPMILENNSVGIRLVVNMDELKSTRSVLYQTCLRSVIRDGGNWRPHRVHGTAPVQ